MPSRLLALSAYSERTRPLAQDKKAQVSLNHTRPASATTRHVVVRATKESAAVRRTSVSATVVQNPRTNKLPAVAPENPASARAKSLSAPVERVAVAPNQVVMTPVSH